MGCLQRLMLKIVQDNSLVFCMELFSATFNALVVQMGTAVMEAHLPVYVTNCVSMHYSEQ